MTLIKNETLIISSGDLVLAVSGVQEDWFGMAFARTNITASMLAHRSRNLLFKCTPWYDTSTNGYSYTRYANTDPDKRG
jgi:lauroyl/myristoyl acyltransferase